MRVFVAGATGVIGRVLVPRLVAAGHEVTGMTRSEQGAGALRAQGADAVVADAFDAARVEQAVTGAAPQVVVHQLTSIPQRMNPRKMDRDFAVNDRLREEGTRHLVVAARAAGARRMVAQSVAFFYDPAGGGLKSEDDPLHLAAPAPLDRTVRALASLEAQVLGADGLEGVVLRYGFFYGPGTAYAADGSQAEQVRRRRLPVIGSGAGVFSFIHVEDAAMATVAAVAADAPGIYNIVDGEPAPWRDWLPFYADALGAGGPRHVPAFLARLAAGRVAVWFATEMVGASNAKARRELRWEPSWPSWRRGFIEAAGQAHDGGAGAAT